MAVSAIDALNTLKAALADGGLETPAEGFRTAAQWAHETGHSAQHVARLLRSGQEQGLVEEVQYRVRTGKVIRSAAHYRMKESPFPVSRNKKK